MNLPDRLVAIHADLEKAGVPHAFGGAIALAYWTLNPRGTIDIDLNLFLEPSRAREALDALPGAVARDDSSLRAIEETGQARVWWEETPIDLFFDYVPIHQAAARNRRIVPFEDAEIPILGPVELAVFKAMFDRTRDWADIEDMLGAETLDVDEVREYLVSMVGEDDPRVIRLDSLA